MFHDYFCNCVNNSQEINVTGCIEVTYSEFIVENCTILGEYGKGKQFAITQEAKFTIINCNLDKLDVFKSDIKGKFKESNNVINNELKPLYHISTRKCEAIQNINNADNQQKQDKLFCPIKIKPEETLLVLYLYPTLCQIIEQLSLCIIFETN